MKKIKLGIVGTGLRGKSMFKIIGAMKGVVPTAACDVSRDSWFTAAPSEQPMSELYPKVEFYESFDKMLENSGINTLLVETPATCHADFCAKALLHGVNVYSDIPTVRTLAEADMLWKAHSKSDAMFMTGATTMGWGFILKMQSLFRSGVMGAPISLEAEYIHDCRYLWEKTPWREPSKEDSFAPIRYCTHSLGPLLSIMDEDLKSVYCVSTGSKITDNEYADDYMTAIFQTPSGVALRLTCSFINNSKICGHSYRVFSTDGYFENISAREDGVPHTRYNTINDKDTEKLTPLAVDFSPYSDETAKKFKPKDNAAAGGHGGADGYLMQLFVDALLNGKPSPIPLRDGLKMTIPGIYAAESAIRKKRLTIRYPWEKGFARDARIYNS